MLEKLLERLKNQELTKEQEIELREEIKEIDSQIESNIQNRRTESLMKIRKDEDKLKELDEIRSKLEKVRKKEKRRKLLSCLVSLPIALLFIGTFFGGIMVSNVLNLGSFGGVLTILASVTLLAGITAPFAYMDSKNHEQNRKEEKVLLARYEELVNATLDKIAYGTSPSASKDIGSIGISDQKGLDREVALPKELIEEGNIESF